MTPPRTRGQRGSTSVEVVLTAPALLLMLMLIVQFGLVAHARSVARSAAEDGAAKARVFNGSATTAEAATNTQLDDLGPTIIANRSVEVSRTDTTATVTVTGTVISLVPGLSFDVHETSSGPVERFVPSSGEFAISDGSSGGN